MWVIELENQGYAQSFGTPSADPYLARTLRRMGALLENYYAIGHSSAANYVAEISGQAPNIATQSDCPVCFDQNSASIGATVTRSFTASASCRSSVIKASASSWVRATYSASNVSGHPSRSATFHAAF